MTGSQKRDAFDSSICKMCSCVKVDKQCRPRSYMDIQARTRSSSNFVSFRMAGNLLILAVFMVLQSVTHGFNLDTEKFVEFRGDNVGSYYGYSVAMLDLGGQNKWLLVGAPKDSSVNLPGIKQPGAVYKCSIPDGGSQPSCSELKVDDKVGTDSANFNGVTRIFEHGHDGQWLGAVIDVNKNKGVVTCASRWYNTYFFKTKEEYYMNGMCYEIPLDFNPNNVRKIPALIDGTKQTMKVGNGTKYNYGMAGLGMTAHYTEQGSDLLLGVPGLRTWTGGFVDIRQTNAYYTEYLHKATEDSEMMGYAITSGEFFGNDLTYFAVGAPRDQLVGRVYLFRGNRVQFVAENADLILDGTEGEQITAMPVNSFYGAALCSCDVTNDGKDDLLVGAPLYAESTGKDLVMEEGFVMVYIGVKDLTFDLMKNVLTGSGAPGGRFGTAMACLGDINKDSYNDVVIGAPYEDDMQGAIYIYNGCKTGLWPRYSQRIAAATMATGLMSFGISFSRSEDMNNDDVNDVAVGAYLSDKAYLIFGQSVVNINIEIDTKINLIDVASSKQCVSSDGKSILQCFDVDVCLKYTDPSFQYIDVTLQTTLDVYMDNANRIAFVDNNNNLLEESIQLFSNIPICNNQKNVYIKSTSDLVTPVLLKTTYKVDKIYNSKYVPPTINSFDGADPSKDKLVAKQLLEFKKDCPGNQCNTDLTISTVAVYEDTDGYFVLGTPTVTLDVTIAKTGDPSYSSNLFVAFPKEIQFQKVVKKYGDPDVTCGYVQDEATDGEEEVDSLESLIRANIPSKTEREFMVGCSFGNPLYNNTGVSFSLTFGVPDNLTDTAMNFRLNSTTLSTETNPTDNAMQLSVGVRHKVDTAFIGVSRPSYIRINDTKLGYAMSHTFELRNRGPSSLPAASLTIRYPQVQSGGSAQLFLNKTTWNCPYPCTVTCSFTDDPGSSPVVYSEEVGPTYYVNESPSMENIGESKQMKSVKNLDCLESNCVGYSCTLTRIPARESAVISLAFYIDGGLLEEVAGGKAQTAKSEGRVQLRETSKLITDETSHYTVIATQILPLAQPPQKLAWWIILLSVLGGILLIVLMVLCLWKCGFFRRKDREALQKMQHTGEVEKMLQEDMKDA